MVALWCAMPAGLAHSRSLKISPTAAPAAMGGGFASGAVGAARSFIPKVSLTPSLSPTISPSLTLTRTPLMTLSAPTASVALPAAGTLAPVAAMPALRAGLARPDLVIRAETANAQGKSSIRRRKSVLSGLRAGSKAGIAAAAAAPAAGWALAGRVFHGEAKKANTVEPDFNGASAAEEATKAEQLPPFLKVGDPKDAEFLAQVYQEAMKSKTGASVLKRIEELSGGGRQPTLIELFDYRDSNEGEVTFDWELVRLDKHLIARGPANAAPSFIHELTHVLQIAEGLPYGALELEIEAYLHSLKVAHELGLSFKKGHFLDSASRSFRRSLNSFIDFVTESYDDSFSLLNGSFEDMEKRLLKEKRQGDRNIAEYEATLADRRQTYKKLKAAGHGERFLKSYYAAEIKVNRTNITSEEASLYWVIRDLKILNTEAGRRRYLKFSRRVLKAARQFQRRVRYESARKKAKRISLPTAAQLKAFKPAPMDEKKGKHSTRKPIEIPETPAELPEGIQVLPESDVPWVGAVLAELRKSAVGAERLDVPSSNRKMAWLS
ncbi:MAG: hypothetical protein V3S11_03290, partial [Elusimicrobiota bacterium]